MRAGPNFKIYIWFWQAQLLKENLGHVGIIMLTSVHEQLRIVPGLFKGSHDWCHFHEVRPGTYDVHNKHAYKSLLLLCESCSVSNARTEWRMIPVVNTVFPTMNKSTLIKA